MKQPKQCDLKLKTSIGGQALMEGIMMRGPQKTSMACRNPEGDIILETWTNPTKKRAKIWKLPILRGIVGFIVDSLIVGYKCLMHSAEVTAMQDVVDHKGDMKPMAKDSEVEMLIGNGPVPGYTLADLREENAKEKAKAEAKAAKKAEKARKKGKEVKEDDDKISEGTWGAVIVFSVVIALALCIGLFVVLPTLLYVLFSGLMLKIDPSNALFLPDAANAGKWTWQLIMSWFGRFDFVETAGLSAGTLALRSLIKSAFEGVLKVVLLVAYMGGVSFMKEIKRTYMYHGAEHKTIFCYEHGLELTVENVRRQEKFHPRCGTSFLILMLLIGIFVSFFIDPLCVLIAGTVPPLAVRIIIKICLVPLIMGIGYEVLKFTGKHDNRLTRIISAPGLALQHITVLEPTDDMIECAIAAVKKVIPDDGSDRI